MQKGVQDPAAEVLLQRRAVLTLAAQGGGMIPSILSMASGLAHLVLDGHFNPSSLDTQVLTGTLFF